jgi:hypothetical protein
MDHGRRLTSPRLHVRCLRKEDLLRQKPDQSDSSPKPASGNADRAEADTAKPAANTRPPADPATFSPERIRGEWAQLKKRAKLAWSELSEYDFNRADGSAAKLHEIIEKRFGGTIDSIRTKLDSLRRA